MMRQRKIVLLKKHLRAVALAVVVLAVCISAGVGISRAGKNSVEAENITYVEYYVQTGDTLWDIAKAYSNNNVDLREFIREIEEKNQITGAFIYSGDMLLVPTKYSGE